MTIDDIISSMEVISFFNPNMASLLATFDAQAETVEGDKQILADGHEQGGNVYEMLVVVNMSMANAIHDYTYNVIRPFDSVIVKNSVREQICRQVYGIEAHF
jgi:hypothetical protein